MSASDNLWISGDRSLMDLNEANQEKNIGCLNFVDVCFTNVSIKRMEVALKGRRVERIGIAACRGQIDEALSVIFCSVQVECLKLDSQYIAKKSTAKVIQAGIVNCSSLKCLILQTMMMTDTLAEALCHGLQRTKSLHSLYLSSVNSRGSDQHWARAILCALQNNCSLRHLGIARVQGLDATNVFDSIRSHPTLESISFACIDGVESSILKALSELAESSDSRVKTIKLSVRGEWSGLQSLPNRHVTPGHSILNSKIQYHLTISTSGQSDMDLLGTVLLGNDDIKYLSLAHCGLDEDEVARLASYLSGVRGLETLSLQGNSLRSGKGCDAVLAALEHNQILERIDFPVVVEQQAVIDHLLDCNRAGRRVIRTTNVPDALWPHILRRAGSLDYTRTYPLFKRKSEIDARRANAVFHLLRDLASIACSYNSGHGL